MPRGTLICFEGLDRTGKSTQAARLVLRLRSLNLPVLHLRFPDRTTPIGQQINSYLTNSTDLSDQAIHLLFSANRWEHAQEIREAIAAGTTVVMDRYVYSGVVYSVAKGVEGLRVDWCWAPEVGLPRPDLTVYLQLREGEAESREGFGGERYEKREVQARVKGLFEELVGADDRAMVVEAKGSVEKVEGWVWEAVEGAMGTIGKRQPPLLTVEKR